uniref:Gap junction protein n=1 Tax=Sinocyclocheilus rhinocerous TaxID=307959 RepID=A0A673ISC0_9TELE
RVVICLTVCFCSLGKAWLVLVVFLRILVLLFAGYPLFQDEQERFVCNTIQPGCANVCYDMFAPLSLGRFWLVQLTTLCLPYAMFVIYTVVKAEKGRVQCFTGAYILHLLLRILVEAGFGVAHYYLFGFHIPKRFMCQQPPCTTMVDCYISRPTEKTIMLNFMLGAAALSLLLNVCDLICAVKRSMRQKSKGEMLVERMYAEEQYYLSGNGNQGMPTSWIHVNPWISYTHQHPRASHVCVSAFCLSFTSQTGLDLPCHCDNQGTPKAFLKTGLLQPPRVSEVKLRLTYFLLQQGRPPNKSNP